MCIHSHYAGLLIFRLLGFPQCGSNVHQGMSKVAAINKGWSNIIWMYNKGSCDAIWTYNFEQFSKELVEVLVLNKDEKSTAGR